MYLFADLVIILVFLIGSAVLGFLLGRRSFRGQIDHLLEQLQDRQQVVIDMKRKLNRCTAKRVALEQELTEVRTHLSGQGIDADTVEGHPSSVPTAAPLSYVSTASPRHSETVQASPGQRFRRASRPQTLPTPPPASAPVAKVPSKQDEVLQRVRARSHKVDFERIGTAEARGRDDLKEIKGVGIFTEKKLNALGIYTFAQIARFSEEDQNLVSAAIEFPSGRIAHDEWVPQARELESR